MSLADGTVSPPLIPAAHRPLCRVATFVAAVWAQLADGQSQDLIVEFADSASKQAALLSLPSNEFEVLKDYEELPLMYIRFRSAAALKALLANPLVVNAYEDRQEDLMPQKEVR